MTPVIVLGEGRLSPFILKWIEAHDDYVVKAVLDERYIAGFTWDGVIYAEPVFFSQLLTVEMKVVVCCDDNAARKQLTTFLPLQPDHFLTIIHPETNVAASAQIGCGTIIMPGVVIQAHTSLGAHCNIHADVTIGRDCEIADFTSILDSARLDSFTSIGVGGHVEEQGIISSNYHLGHWSIARKGAVVMDHIPGYSEIAGCPAQIIDRRPLQR